MRANSFAQHLHYMISKFGISIEMFGLSKEPRDAGIVCNVLWLRTAAVEFALFCQTMRRQSRRPEIMADAAYAIL